MPEMVMIGSDDVPENGDLPVREYMIGNNRLSERNWIGDTILPINGDLPLRPQSKYFF